MAFYFNGNTPKKILYNGLNVAKLIYNGVVVWLQKALATIEGILPLTLTDCTGDDLVNYKIYGNSEYKVLPDGYTQVEYIQGTGTQYIDIGRKMYNNSEIELCFSFDEIQQDCSIFGSRDSATVNNFEIASSLPAFPLYLDFGNYNTSRATYSGATINTKYICTISKSLRAVYDENHTLLARNTTGISADNVTRLYARLFDTAGGFSSRKLKGKVYYCKIWENGVLVRNMIPCINQSNVAGMYDTVNGGMYTNAGTGTFIVGSVVFNKTSVGDLVTDTSDINYGKYKIPVLTNSHTTNIYLNKPLRKTSKLPSGYTQVEYLESTGTQYIDTRYYPNNLTDVECKFIFNQIPGNAVPSVFGVRASNNSVQQFLTSVSNGVLWVVNGLNNTDIPSVRPLVNTEYILRITPQKAYWNGTEILTMGNSVANCPNLSMFAFGRNTYSGLANQFSGKIYYLKIYEAGVLVRNFIPCINPSNEIGMYDLVNDVFYSNAGSDSFIAGAEIEPVYYTDYLDYGNQKVVRNVDDNDKGIDTPVEESVVLPAVPTDEGTTVFDVGTDVIPSYAEVKYYTKSIENKTLKTSDNLVFVTSDNKIFKLKEEE